MRHACVQLFRELNVTVLSRIHRLEMMWQILENCCSFVCVFKCLLATYRVNPAGLKVPKTPAVMLAPNHRLTQP